MDSGPQNASASSGAGGFAVYFDGTSSRRRLVTLEFNDRLEIIEYEHTLAVWSYADIRRADSGPGTLRQATSDYAWQGRDLEAYAFIALMFWVACFAMSRFAATLETRRGVETPIEKETP